MSAINAFNTVRMQLWSDKANVCTVDRQVAKCSARSALNLRVVTAQEEQNRVERVPSHRSNFLLGDLCESEGSTSLEVHII